MPDPRYQTFSFITGSRGLVARYAIDRAPEGTWLNLDNMELREEMALSSRFGLDIITTDGADNTPLGASVHTLGRLKGLSQTFRYGGAGTTLRRRTGDTNGAYTQIGTGFSGSRFSMVVYRPDFSSFPYIFFADKSVMKKDNGTFGTVQNWGILPPTIPAILQVQAPSLKTIEDFENQTGMTFVNYTSPTNPSRVDTTLATSITTAPGISEVTPASMTDIVVGSRLIIDQGDADEETVFVIEITETTFKAFFQNNHPTLTASIVAPPTGASRVSNVVTITTAAAHGFAVGETVVIASVTDSSFNGTFVIVSVPSGTTFTYSQTAGDATSGNGTAEKRDTIKNLSLKGNVAASTEATVSKSVALDLSDIGGKEVDEDDEIHLFIKVSNPARIEEIRILFDVGDGSFDEDYYWKAVAPSEFQPAVDREKTARDAMFDRVFDRAGGGIDFRDRIADRIDRLGRGNALAFGDLLPIDDESLRALRSAELFAGLNRWSRISVKQKEFVKVGLADEIGHTWKNVGAWRIIIKTTSKGSITAALDDFYLVGADDGLDVFAGSPYDYRYTYYNINTGAESSPSRTIIEDNFVKPRRQPVKTTWTPSTDGQVTHVRTYRRGGLLPSNYLLVAEKPNSDGSVVDDKPDRLIALAKILELDNDPPVTSTLQTPVDTTLGTVVTAGSTQTVTPASMTDIFPNQRVVIDDGKDEEVVVVQSTTGTTFDAFFQNAHGATTRVQATTRIGKPMHLAAIGFDRAWLAGDPDNPHYLYYSKKFRPETFAPQNFIEIGTPKDPIMAVVDFRGQIFVFTLARIYRVLSPGSVVPVAFPTSSRHGLFASFGWILAEGEIWYVGYDGIYRFAGGNSTYMSEPIEWLFSEQALGPVVPMDLAKIGDTVMAYDKNEVFIAYTDTGSVRRRVMWHTVYGRWRNDSLNAESLLFEDDSFKLILGKADGNIFRDRSNNAHDNVGFAASIGLVEVIAIDLRAPSLDHGLPKNEKIYNELTLDINAGGNTLTVDLLFDNGNTVVNVGTVATSSRQQVQFNINAGKGQKSRDVSLRLTGNVQTNPMAIYEAHIRAWVEAELRRSWDTYWSKYGTDMFKLLKQAWFEYSSSADINVDVFVEGKSTAEFSFTLPNSNGLRAALRVRFPATKAKLFRWIGTSAQDFQFYEETHAEVKLSTTDKGYVQVKLAA